MMRLQSVYNIHPYNHRYPYYRSHNRHSSWPHSSRGPNRMHNVYVRHSFSRHNIGTKSSALWPSPSLLFLWSMDLFRYRVNGWWQVQFFNLDTTFMVIQPRYSQRFQWNRHATLVDIKYKSRIIILYKLATWIIWELRDITPIIQTRKVVHTSMYVYDLCQEK